MGSKGSGKTDFVCRDHRKWFIKRLLLKVKKKFLKDTENEVVDARKW